MVDPGARGAACRPPGRRAPACPRQLEPGARRHPDLDRSRPDEQLDRRVELVGQRGPGGSRCRVVRRHECETATINAAVNISGLDDRRRRTRGAITQSAAVTIGATGFSQAGASFSGGAAAITVNGPFTISGGSFSATTGVLSIAGNLTHTAGGTFSANGGTVALITGAATIDVAASETFNDLRFTAGAKTVAAGDSLIATGR